MNISLRPGYVYAFISEHNPGEIKIGYAENWKDRLFSLSLGDPYLQKYRVGYFLDMVQVEQTLHRKFAAMRVSRSEFEGSWSENFKISKRAFDIEFKKIQASQSETFQAFQSKVRGMVDLGELKMDPTDNIEACNGTAISSILTYVPDLKDGRNVKALIADALSRSPASNIASSALSKLGLVPYPAEGLVLLNKEKGSALSRVFKGRNTENTWRAQLKEFAGFNAKGAVKKLTEWLDTTNASESLIDKVSPCGYNS